LQVLKGLNTVRSALKARQLSITDINEGLMEWPCSAVRSMCCRC